MSGQSPSPDLSQPKATTRAARAKIRILLPIALAVVALSLFLMAFWPDSHAGKKSHTRRGQITERGGSPVGGAGREDLEDLGNSPVTRGGGSPVGGREAPARSKSKAGGWWYRHKGKSSAGDKGDQWWYQDKKGEAKTRTTGEAATDKDGDRDREADAAKKSEPNNNWWHD
jgi:hypothetical protein